MNTEKDQLIEMYYKEMYPKLMAYANSVVKNRFYAEEAVQDTFQIACQKSSSFLTSPNPQGWLMLTMKNVLKNASRDSMRTRETVTESLLYDSSTFLGVRSERELDIMYSDLISEDDYRMLKLVALHNYTMRDIAEEFGINVDAARKRVQRARDKLRAKLNKIEKRKNKCPQKHPLLHNDK